MASVNVINSDTLKCIICYYSGSGNTKLACQYIAGNIKNTEFKLFNIAREGIPDLDSYDIAGFACFTDFIEPPYLFRAFLDKLKRQTGKPAFVFNTYGFISGKTRITLDKWVTAKGFKVLAGHSLHTPESYPPMIAGGRGNEQAPNEKELKEFNRFISGLEESFNLLRNGKKVRVKMRITDILVRILPVFSRTRSKKEMGIKYVDAELCKECHTCEKLCPYKAIKLDPKPIFDMTRCYGCWSCYNHCPNKAIYTRKYRAVGQYPKPIEQLKNKLKV
jgi:ferredoxin/flavodoxin